MANDQRWESTLYDDKHSFVWKHGASLIELLAPQAGERILDLGCGTGHLTAQIAAMGAEVLGLDASPHMIEQARAQYPHLAFVQADARSFTVAEPWDAVFSNAVLHWIHEAADVARCVRKALKLGGRFVAELGGNGNVRRIEDGMRSLLAERGLDIPGPLWFFPSIAEYSRILETHGLEVIFATLFDRPTPLEGDDGLRNWVIMFAPRVLERVPSDERPGFFAELESRLAPSLRQNRSWFADYRRLRVVARASSEPEA